MTNFKTTNAYTENSWEEGLGGVEGWVEDVVAKSLGNTLVKADF